MDVFYKDIIANRDFQDAGHTGMIHDASSVTDKHLSMFYFEFVPGYEKFVSFTFILHVKYKYNTVASTEPLFKVIPGVFRNPSAIPFHTFIDEASFYDSGWEPITVPDGSAGIDKTLEKIIYSVPDKTFNVDFVFPFSGTNLGFRIEPFYTSGLDPTRHFEFEFYTVSGPEKERPKVRCVPAEVSLLIKDSGGSKDATKYLAPDLDDLIDEAFGKDIARPEVFFGVRDSLKYAERSLGLRINGTDPAYNYSMQIKHIALKDKAKCIEVYGFNGYTDRYYYPDFGRVFEKQTIKKLNFVTWSGLLVEWPWCAMLWYGEILYFADQDEFGECCRLYFKEHGEDDCPICGEPLGGQLQYSFIDITRIPHQFYFCSKECMHRFNSNLMLYLKLNSKPNMDYLLDMKL